MVIKWFWKVLLNTYICTSKKKVQILIIIFQEVNIMLIKMVNDINICTLSILKDNISVF